MIGFYIKVTFTWYKLIARCVYRATIAYVRNKGHVWKSRNVRWYDIRLVRRSTLIFLRNLNCIDVEMMWSLHRFQLSYIFFLNSLNAKTQQIHWLFLYNGNFGVWVKLNYNGIHGTDLA